MATPLSLLHQLFVSGAWTTYPSFADSGWEYQVGPDVETGSRPSRLAFTFNNNDLSMDPTNVAGPLYELIGRNTPARQRLQGFNTVTVEASSWQPDTTVEHIATGQAGAPKGKAWCDFSGEGLLRRLGRWTDPLRSAMVRQTNSYAATSLGYWPMEDPAGATQFSNQITGGLPGTFAGTVNLSGDPGAGGSDTCPTIGSDGVLRTTFKSSTGNGYQLVWCTKLATMPTSATYQVIASWQDSLRNTWKWSVNNVGYTWDYNAPDGTFITGLTTSFGASNPTIWTRYRFKISISGGTITYEPAWYSQDTVVYGVTNTYAGTATGRPLKWTASGNAWTTNAAYGHVFAITDTTLDLTNGYAPAAAFNGYLNERAYQRIFRLMNEHSLMLYVNGNSLLTAPMGRQKPGTLLELIEECVRTEAGILYDEPTDIALTVVPVRNLINATVQLTLTKSQLLAPLTKVIDDVNAVNDITISNAEGSSVNLALATGPLSVLAPPNGMGRIKGLVEVNYANANLAAVLADRANWELRKGTLNRPRYLQVSLSLLANPGLTGTVTNVRPGHFIKITGVEPDQITLRVISINRRGGAVDDVVTFNCLPADQYVAGVYDATSSRYDSSSTTLAAAIATTGATSVSLTTSIRGDAWSTTSLPYDIMIKGERMTVTAMTAVAGTGPYTQTATVTRAVNGVAKTHLIGAEVHLFPVVRYALGG